MLIDPRSVEVLIDRFRAATEAKLGAVIGVVDDEASFRYTRERGLGLVGGQRVSYFLEQCAIFPEAGSHVARFASPCFAAFAATADDHGDILMGVDDMGKGPPLLLWLRRPAMPRNFLIRRRVRHRAVRRGVCPARHRDNALVLDRGRVSLVPFAALRAIPAAE